MPVLQHLTKFNASKNNSESPNYKTIMDDNQNGKLNHSTTSHHIVYTFLIIYSVVAGWGLIVATILVFKNPDAAIQVIIPYLSYVAAFGAVIPFYLNKSKDEYARRNSLIKNRQRLDLAKDIHKLKRSDALDSESISDTKVLISDTDTQITYPGGGGGPTIYDQDTYSAPATDEGGQNA